MVVLNWIPQFVDRVPVYPARSTPPGSMRNFRSLQRPRSRPSWPTWIARSTHLRPADRDELLALYTSSGFGGGDFLWTPPGETQQRCRLVPNSLSFRQPTALRRYAIEVQIEKV